MSTSFDIDNIRSIVVPIAKNTVLHGFIFSVLSLVEKQTKTAMSI